MIAPADPALLDEVRALRDSVSALQAAVGTVSRVDLRAIQPRPYLGQPVTFVVTVTDAQGAPRPNRVVTLLASWGRIRPADRPDLTATNSLTARTDLDGIVQVTLLPPTSEDLLPTQQEALESLLAGLDPGATSPGATLDGLKAMASQYAWEVNVDFRRAVDIYFRDFQPGLLDTVNEHDFLASWSSFNATVVALAHDAAADAGGGRVDAIAAETLAFKDWLGPWLETYQEVVQSASTLQQDIQGTTAPSQDAGTVLTHVYDHLNDFLAQQRGVAGQIIGRQVAGASIRTLLDTGLSHLPASTGAAIFPALQSVAGAVTQVGPGVVSVLGQTRTDLKRDVTAVMSDQSSSALAGFRTSLSQSAGDALKQFQTSADAARGSALTGFQGDLTKARGDQLTGFLGDVTKVRGDQLTGFQGDVGKLRTDQFTGFQADVTKFRGDNLQSFQGDVTKSRTDNLLGFQGDVTKFRGDQLAGFQGDVGKVRGDQLTAFQGDVTKLRSDQLTGFQADVTKARGDQLSGYQSDVSKFRSEQLTGFQGDVSKFRSDQFTGFQGDVSKLRSDQLTGFQGDVTKFRGDQLAGFQGDVTKFRGDQLTGYQGDVTKLRADQLTGFQADVGRVQSSSLADFQKSVETVTSRNDVVKRLSTLETSVSGIDTRLVGLNDNLHRRGVI